MEEIRMCHVIRNWKRGAAHVSGLAALAALGASLSAHATNYWVGSDSQCDYSMVSDAIAAASSQLSGSFPKIYIASNQTYTNQALSIGHGEQSHISLIGGVPHCGTTAAAGSTTLNGGLGTSVITIRGAITVTLSHLVITGGDDVIGGNDDEGGGVDYAGIGQLQIDNTTIFDNVADNGGGIRFKGDGGAADLYLNENTFITGNTANATGGGIRIEDDATAHIDADQTWIAQNEATNGYGGGIAVVGNALVHIGSPGYRVAEYAGVVYQNTAQYGGGIALIGTSYESAPEADIFAVDASNPVRIEQNRAFHTGGGVYLVPYVSNGGIGHAYLEVGAAHIDGNAAPEGSGIYADTDSAIGFPFDHGGSVHIYPGYCASGIACNSVSNNRAVDGAGAPTAGSAILLQTDADFEAHQLTMRANQGAHAIRVADGLNSPLTLDTCLLAGNSVTSELVALGSASATLNQCTFANNTIGGTAVVRAQTGFTLTRSIFAQGQLTTVAYSGTGNGETLDYILSLETASLGSGQHIIAGDPAFVDPAGGDFHLRANSPAIDVAPAGDAADRDLDGLPRDIDLANVPNGDGPRDLGAYELQSAFPDCGASDTIMCDGFERIQ
jgi:hypothetical protein